MTTTRSTAAIASPGEENSRISDTMPATDRTPRFDNVPVVVHADASAEGLVHLEVLLYAAVSDPATARPASRARPRGRSGSSRVRAGGLGD